MTKKRSSRPPSGGASPRSRRAKRDAPVVAGGKRGTTRTFAAVAALLSLLTLGVLLVPLKKKDGSGRPVDVELPSGASDDDVVARLHAAGAIDSPGGFALYLRLTGGGPVKRGRHLLSDDLSMAEIARRIRRSPSAARVRVTIPEGFHRFDIAKRLRDKRICDEQAFLAATIDPTLMNELGLGASAEGYLFPATYDFPSNVEAADVVRRMVAEAKGRIDKLLQETPDAMTRLKPLGMGVGEAIVLASIVEKEAVADEERPIIASVFFNRLRDPKETGGRLEADPTAGYGCLTSVPPPPTCVAWLSAGSTKVNAAIQHDPENRWSTYTHAGLPPTPIASPGEKSIAAVLAPANTKYFYFVAKGGGHHTFSESRAAHDAAVHPGK